MKLLISPYNVSILSASQVVRIYRTCLFKGELHLNVIFTLLEIVFMELSR